MRAALLGVLVAGIGGGAMAQAQKEPGRLQGNPQLPEGVEAISLLGRPLRSAPLAEAQRAELESRLAEARAAVEARPNDPEAVVWLGRRTAYLGRFREAIAVYTTGIGKYPKYAPLYRHRGHRYITVRELDNAIADFERAAALTAGAPDEIEPDGIPNARNTPTSTLQSNIYYHLGLARYLKRDFAGALAAYRECMKRSKNADMQVATSHWLYMTLRRMGREAEARQALEPITPQMDIIENGSYHRLLLMYKGVLTPEELLAQASGGTEIATIGYGVANWHFYNGRREEGLELMRKVVSGETWAAFAFIAAEADLAREEPRKPVPAIGPHTKAAPARCKQKRYSPEGQRYMEEDCEIRDRGEAGRRGL